MTSTKPTPTDMLLPPAMIENPSPLRVSTFAKPEYAKLTFVYGKVKDDSASWPVHCKWFKVCVPTGRQASALTSEPKLIRNELTIPEGKRQWTVERDDRDPNQTVFTCSPPPGQPAVFDGTWQVQLELWGIEVNGGAGPVDITWEESTSTDGSDFLKRTGRGEVSKRDDSFYLHSFRPESVAISRDTKAVLHWEGTPSAEYTMYYRKPDGTQGSSPAKDGRWESPVNLVDDSSFTLKAEMGDEVRYLTTYIKVNNADIAVTNVTAKGNVTADPGVNGYIWLKTGRFDAAAEAKINAYGDVAVTKIKATSAANDQITLEDSISQTAGGIATQGSITVGGNVTASGGVTVGGTLTANGNIVADPGANGYIWLKTGRFDTAAAATINAHGPLNTHGALTTNNLTVNGNMTATGAGKSVRIRNLYGPVKQGGETKDPALAIKSNVSIDWELWVERIHGRGPYNHILVDGNVAFSAGVTSGGSPVIRAGDKVSLRNERKVNGKDSRLLADNKYDSGGYLNVYSYEGYQGSNGNNWFIEKR
ncbi:hypothetical protein Q3V23_34055 [Streptomyces sp. VNUA116]|uniref:hypothetical protein n=1 Tax=Streptomyces sp. VNUA116 TaxID=3062449 RepID=UPI0026763F64|nr:hypothetical protein [Streptomyces sp. VNUA116]WKU48695.1 hypothetical protein Q3V23_34055 [Streptomyces sp. VNUA116]